MRFIRVCKACCLCLLLAGVLCMYSCSKSVPDPNAKNACAGSDMNGCYGQEDEGGHVTIRTKSGKDVDLNYELADDGIERSIGLMYRDRLGEDSAMLFTFEKQSETSRFWMKNMRFPIDMIFVNESWDIIYIEHSAPPCRSDPCALYGPIVPYSAVLEVNAGLTGDEGISVGDRLIVG